MNVKTKINTDVLVIGGGGAACTAAVAAAGKGGRYTCIKRKDRKQRKYDYDRRFLWNGWSQRLSQI